MYECSLRTTLALIYSINFLYLSTIFMVLLFFPVSLYLNDIVTMLSDGGFYILVSLAGRGVYGHFSMLLLESLWLDFGIQAVVFL